MMVVAPESVIGLPWAAVDALLDGVLAPEVDAEHGLSYMIWSHIAEPGDLLAGLLVSGIGPVESLKVMRSQDPARQAVTALRQVTHEFESESDLEGELVEAFKRWRGRDNNAAVVRSIEVWKRLGGQIVTPEDSDWPGSLANLGYGQPHALWLRGDRSSLGATARAVAVVGSRNVSSYGQYCAQTIAERLVGNGMAVISGGAYGVDAEAHRGALSADGVTIAVLAGGADRLYPVGNTQLLQEVMRTGCVLAEQPPGNSPTRWRFLQRNRLIAALGQATVVVEMAVRSGAKNTMNHALAIGNDVYAVPGSLVTQTARGCNVAIAEGKAKIVTGFDELIADLNDEPYSLGTEFDLSPLQQRVLDALHQTPINVSRISVKAGTTTSETMQALGALEALQLVEPRGAGWRKFSRVTE
jgi:DNA processing protein